MGQETIPSYVVAANAQRDLYYSEERFKKAREFVVASGFEDVVAAQDKQLADFLSGRNVKQDATLEQLVKMQEPQAVLLGAAFHFSRKFFTTSHDCGEDVKNPVPLTQNVFDSLVASDDKHAAKILEELNDLSSNNTYTQRKVVGVVAGILPNVTIDYVTSLRNLELKHKAGSTPYNAEKAQLDKKQMTLVDKVLKYTNQVIRTNQEPSLENFKKYAGMNGQSKEDVVGLTAEYIERLARQYGRNHTAAIAQMQQDGIKVVWADWNANYERAQAKAILHTGTVEQSSRNVLTYSKRSALNEVRDLLVAVCNNSLGNPNLPPDLRIKTIQARDAISSYLGRA